MITMVDKLYKRNLFEKILPLLRTPEAIVIYGSRQVGKTTLMHQLQAHLGPNTFFIDLEMPDMLALCRAGPEAVQNYLLQKGAEKNGKIYLLIDEIQYLEDPAKYIKLTHDHHPGIKLIVSGSSSFEIRKKFSPSLTGRLLAFELWPLSFEEFLEFREKSYRLRGENEAAINRELVPLAEEYIRFGGYPRIVLEEDEQKKKLYLSQIMDTYIRKDIRDIGNIRDIGAFNRLLEVLSAQSGQLLNASALSQISGLSRPTVEGYLELLEKTFVIRRLTPFSGNKQGEIYKNPKLYMADTGLMHLLWLKEFPKVILGPSFETFAYLELEKTGRGMHFWRTNNRQEVDFILEGEPLYAIEAKLNFNSTSARHLQTFSGLYTCRTEVVGLHGDKNGKYVWEMAKEIEEGTARKGPMRG